MHSPSTSLNGLNNDAILRNLTDKYGAARIRKGRFVSDHSYLWDQDGIEIELRTDWQNYRTRLMYVDPANLATLISEQSEPAQEPDKAEHSIF